MKDKLKNIIRPFIIFILLLALVAISYIILDEFNLTKISKEKIQEIVKSSGPFGPLLFILITFLQVTFIPIPASVTIIAGSYLFGPWLSFLYSVIGLFFGGLFAFFLGKKIGRPFVNWLVNDKEKVDKWIKKLKGREKILLFFMLLMPFFPDDLLCSIAGLLPINYPIFIFMSLFTRITSTATTLVFMSGEIIPYSGWGLVLIVIMLLISIILFIFSIKYTDKIEKFYNSIINKIYKKKR